MDKTDLLGRVLMSDLDKETKLNILRVSNIMGAVHSIKHLVSLMGNMTKPNQFMVVSTVLAAAFERIGELAR